MKTAEAWIADAQTFTPEAFSAARMIRAIQADAQADMRTALTRIRRETVPGSLIDELARRALEGK